MLFINFVSSKYLKLMLKQFVRTQMLLGQPAIDTLIGSRVAVFGLGGVGGYVVEVLARSGIGELDLIDNDQVCESNLNRQIFALTSTLGLNKVDVAEKRVRDINPQCIVHKHLLFYTPQNADEIDLSLYDYVVDCIDTVSAKIELAKRCYNLHIPIICCMGAANKLDPTQFVVTDLAKTKMDPLAKIMRKRLRKLNIEHLKVVYSLEEPLSIIDDCIPTQIISNPEPSSAEPISTTQRPIPASNAFVPATAGLIIGGEVVKELIYQAHTMRLTKAEIESSLDAQKAAYKAQTHLKKLREWQTESHL